MTLFGIVKEGEVGNVFLSRHEMGWWGRVSTEVGLVRGEDFWRQKKDMRWPNFGDVRSPVQRVETRP